MEIRHGLISADSHVVTERDAFLERMSKSKSASAFRKSKKSKTKAQRSSAGLSTASRCAVAAWSTAGGDGRPNRNLYPQRWEEVPAKAYVPEIACKPSTPTASMRGAFSNDPSSFHQYNDPEFEIAACRPITTPSAN